MNEVERSVALEPLGREIANAERDESTYTAPVNENEGQTTILESKLLSEERADELHNNAQNDEQSLNFQTPETSVSKITNQIGNGNQLL